MNRQERDNRDALEAVAQLVDLCFAKNAEQIAEIEAQLFLMGFQKLADIVRLQGLNNAGIEYPPIFFKTLQAKFEG